MEEHNIVTIGGLDCYEANGVAYLNLEQAARGRGFTSVQYKNGATYEIVRWNRVKQYLHEIGFLPLVVEKIPAYIPENVFYRLAMKAKNPAAEKFQAWVADEVIPSIRKTGGYIHGQKNMTDDELVAAALLVADRRIKERDKRIDELVSQIEADAPSVHFAKTICVSKDAISIGTFAKILTQSDTKKTGRDRLFAEFRERGYLMKSGADKNMPIQRYVDEGLFQVRESTGQDADGSPRIYRQTLITGKGQQYFITLFLKEKAEATIASTAQLQIQETA